MSEIVWQDTLDGHYECHVERTQEYVGRLIVMDGDRMVLNEPTVLSYNALYGPDAGDVEAWKTRIIDVVDGEQL